ncbi:SUKH-4 family immunity protein [Streptomyces sp. NBC_00510]
MKTRGITGMLTRVGSNVARRWALVQDAVGRVLSQPVSRLVADKPRIPVEVADRWDIPESDRVALREWGLPQMQTFTPHYAGTFPTLLPNRAGKHERRLVKDGQQLYDLGHWGTDPSSCVAGVVPGEGRVLCLLPAPITVDDLPEVLRPYNLGLRKPAVSFFSSSVAQYVETACRWHAALQILQQIEEPEFLTGEAEYVRHHDRLYSLVELVVDAVGRIDPAANAEHQTSVWIELIRQNSV